ncbi:UDP-N-acetylmuramoyl-tripeptide--D-alanyl-D-alanine ligase [Nocardioides sp. dk4132]|uniref:UDP-N-acetylmuramoyl-tripeptide--D-alanyl-D- alanine ligase n=1 Tax=unclassified Nocardioides TaxID=2615069 RepID=UPI001294BA4C|nr:MULTISPECIES: UDP-N-acetylmuramoyl-tripeptide--D-alanyl-D-alanine ligase [unclassified Nocardioides]MQW76965.1 UDP-N-acetylmuramoyl-tripeptide--D-alanyl-D-alanine ligase [Nocardioides sp. dk4132]QGA09383.1 UDP-N-acetylmuramoyl-tripeptide--D-alanyl-D-alanine ligase [Nocardioides sp. dk884]
MIAISLADLAAVVGGTVHGDPATVVDGAAYLDSRRPEPGGLFVAIAGAHADGHAYAASAHAVLGSRPTAAPTVVVRDPQVALARLARHVVDRVAPTTFAITGSHGKTTTKELLAAVLGGGCVATAGNLNNELGVPLTCLRLGAGTRELVLEMGARGLGHLAWLCDVAPPQVAAVLAVGSAHVGEFGSPALVAAAKGELVEALAPSGVAVLNADDPAVAAMAARTTARVLTFGEAGDVSWHSLALDQCGRASFVLAHEGQSAPVRLALTGRHQVANAAAAAAMALAAGRPLEEIAAALSAARPAAASRSTLGERADGLLVLDDSYNANPESVRAALATLVDLGRERPGRTVAVLGEMRELGAASAAAHAAVGAVARDAGVDVLLAVGEAAWPTGGEPVADRDAALAWLRAHVGPGDTVLVKGSRAVGLDAVAAGLLG